MYRTALQRRPRLGPTADEELADQVWEAWDAGKLTDGAACIAWLLSAGLVSDRYGFPPDNISTPRFHVIVSDVFGSLFL